jgi:hypothetical protein
MQRPGARLERVQDGRGVGARVEETGPLRAAHHEQQVQPVLGLGREAGTPSTAGTGHAAADAGLPEEKGTTPCRVVEEFPGQGEDGRMLAADGQEPRLVGILEAVEEPLRGALAEHRLEQRLAPVGQVQGDAPGLAVIRITQRMGAVDLQIPAQVFMILRRQRALEGQRAGVLTAEADDDMVRVGKA